MLHICLIFCNLENKYRDLFKGMILMVNLLKKKRFLELFRMGQQNFKCLKTGLIFEKFGNLLFVEKYDFASKK